MPYFRLSGFYFFHFGSLAALAPFWGPYLLERGFAATAIGALMAILMGSKVVAPNLFGLIADHSGRRMPLVQVGSLLAPLFFTGVFVADSFWLMAVVMAIFTSFWNATLPLMESVTFNHLGTQVSRYASVRVWGSIGFILVVAAVGWWQEQGGTAVVPLAVLMMYLGMLTASLTIPDCDPLRARLAGRIPGNRQPVAAGQADERSLRVILRRPEVLLFLLTCLLMQSSHGAYYVFYSIHLEAQGFSSGAVGQLWALGVACEVLLFLRMRWLLERVGARRLVLASLALALLRWVLIGLWADQLALVIAAQVLHAFTFGAFHASAIHLTHHYFPGRTQGRGQALYNSLSFGVGGASGSLLSGLLWDSVGATASFLVAASIAGLGLLIAFIGVDRQRHY
ncbi:MAG: MFS transporter [Chromatiaceae bacterium]|nr:MAG: MFS transporter [Chromatiaceae bacterium]